MNRILSLDGGGTWALLQAMILENLFQEPGQPPVRGHQVLQHFDLVVANSGGSIIAASLFANLELREIVARFRNESFRNQIFVKLPFIFRVPNLAKFGPKYKSSEKIKGLRTVLPELDGVQLSRLADAMKVKCKLAITAFDYDRQRGKIFRSFFSVSGATSSSANKESSAKEPDDTFVLEAVHASSNAPVNYFDKPAIVDKCRYWDGAVAGHNNPLLVGIAEALATGANREDIHLLSIGTGNNMLPIKDRTKFKYEHEDLLVTPKRSCLLADVKKMAKSILSEPPDWSTYMAFQMLNLKIANDKQPIRLVRVNPLVQPMLEGNRWVYPPNLRGQEWKGLVDLEMDATEQADVDLIHKLGTEFLQDRVVNQSIRQGEELACDIGVDRYSAAARMVKGWAPRPVKIPYTPPPPPPKGSIT